ncbi:MAG: Fic family protein [Verrucomicrobia bacterium]|nr:Fic family protein [Verrucomicrobiota bacterium]
MNPRFQITHRVTAGLTRIERARGFLDAAKLSEDWLATMRSRALLLEAHHTTHIEGTHLTLEQSERLLAGLAVPEADPDDARELLNYRDAFEFVSGYLGDGGPVTEGLIREIHRRLVAGVRGGAGQPGEYRRVQNYVVNSVTRQVIYTPPPPGDVPPFMADLVEWLNAPGEAHPVLTAGIAQFQLVHIHPFVDGNGRTSRLLSTLCLYRAGYDFKRLFSISEFYDRDRPAFYAAIQGVRDRGMDLTGWLDFFVEGLATQMDEVKERGQRVIKADVVTRKHGLNERQSAALRYLFEHGKITIQDFEVLSPQINRRSLQRDLKALVEKGLLQGTGTSPTDPNRVYSRGPVLDGREL